MHRLLTVVFFLSCLVNSEAMAQSSTVQKLDDGVLVSIRNKASGNVQDVRLQVISDRIIRVTSKLPEAEATRKSLMITDSLRSGGKWTIKQDQNSVQLQTAVLNANVSLQTGAVTFKDQNGKVVTSEEVRGPEAFVPGSYSGDAFYRIKQGFEVEPGEAFYGLGQHQNGVMNYRGHQVVLSQYNTDVAVPFMISSKNYGILWDNYSITKVGDVREFQPLSALKLYSAEGKAGWLTATYANRQGNSGNAVVRAESDIDYAFLKDQKNFPEAVKMNDAKVTWEGEIESPYTGSHTFLLKYAGYLKIWLDGKLQADRWRQPWNAGAIEIAPRLEKGKRYKLKIEWIPDGGESYLSAKWQSPIPQSEQNRMAFLSEAGDQIDYYLISGANLDEVISGYRKLTGRAPIVPKWALGFWQSRERYKTQEEILSTVKTFRDKKVPLDNIVLDWSYWAEDQWGSQEFESKRFPNPEQMLSDLHDKYHTRFMISVWPKFYKGTEPYKEFDKNGWLYRRNIEDARRDWIGQGYSSTFYDPFNADARAGFWKLINNKLYKKGVDAWWLDATEPDIHSNLDVETRKTLFSPSTGSGTRYFNAFPLQNAKGIYEGQRAANAEDRVFILTRSAYAGQQRYGATTWSGDISSRWHDMRDQISAGINFSLSGLPYWTMDIGGFSVERRFEKATGADLDEWREMNARWYQFGAFTPIFRVHGQFPYREIYNIAPEGHPAYASMLYYNKLRYRLLPYVYSLAGRAYHENYTIMRGLIMDFTKDQKVSDIDDQYMFGPSLLINPVHEYKARERSVYLPAGSGWYDLYTGKYSSGGKRITASAGYERMPVYVKEGSILPFGPDLQYTSEKQPDLITLYVYTGKDASFTLYEDEGVNYNYEKGTYSTIPIRYHEKSRTLTIGNRNGSFPGMLKTRTFRVVEVSPRKASALNPDAQGKHKVTYSGNSISVRM